MRPKKQRVIKSQPKYPVFNPESEQKCTEQIVIGLDELEALRLTNLQELSQDETAKEMGVSRQLIGLMLSSARKKITDALLNGKSIVLSDNTNN